MRAAGAGLRAREGIALLSDPPRSTGRAPVFNAQRARGIDGDLPELVERSRHMGGGG